MEGFKNRLKLFDLIYERPLGLKIVLELSMVTKFLNKLHFLHDFIAVDLTIQGFVLGLIPMKKLEFLIPHFSLPRILKNFAYD